MIAGWAMDPLWARKMARISVHFPDIPLILFNPAVVQRPHETRGVTLSLTRAVPCGFIVVSCHLLSANMIEAKEFTLPGLEEDGGLVTTLVRYKPPPSAKGPSAPFDRPRLQLSLILLHAIANHKETWLPTVEHLFGLQHAAPTNAFTIVEVWSMDAPNHGRAAILNERRLLSSFADGITGKQCSRAVEAFLKSGLIAPGCSVIGVGHSVGSCVMVQATDDYAVDRLPFASLILVDPLMVTRERLQEAIKEGAMMLRAPDAARARKNVWPSRPEAKEWFAKRLPWRRWDPRVLDLYLEHGLRELPTATYPDLKEGVTTAATREQEAAFYGIYEDSYSAMERLKVICHAMPVHCVFGAINDLVSPKTQVQLVDETVGRRMRSVTRVAGAGHLVVQEKPRELALAIWGILHEDYALPMGIAARL
ncbi:Alpha/beta hydrolase family-domain-containing protein [Trametes punicea]|nr:Alpha/beta hydrolase family-domain-containing protein [Trametes punicea]